MTAATHSKDPLIVGGTRISVEDLCEVAAGRRALALASAPEFRARIERGARFLADSIAAGRSVYGVTTGFGDSVGTVVPPELTAELPLHLTRYHGCGSGRALDDERAAAVLVARLVSLAAGYSGVRWVLLERLALLLQQRALPVIPEEGSVGASGDLTPLSYVAAVLVGEREVRVGGELLDAAALHQRLGLVPLTLAPKEGLAMMNGTAVMTALTCLAWRRAENLTRVAARATALAAIALRGNPHHYDKRLFELKPHPGQAEVAAWIASDLEALPTVTGYSLRLQDRYSLRCAPHVIGVLRDALGWMKRDLEVELNSANDNPLVDPEADAFHHGGHFYGGHVCLVADTMKTAVASVADLLDRQLAQMVDANFNAGLPRNLSGARGPRVALNHGLKAVQIATSAWTAEALKLTMPASSFSRSTECHNQDKVSMGTIAARDCLRVLELSEQVAAACLVAGAQAVSIRIRDGLLPESALPPALQRHVAEVQALCPFIDEDRRLDRELEALSGALRERRWTPYSA